MMQFVSRKELIDRNRELEKQFVEDGKRIKELKAQVKMLGNAHHDEIETRTRNTELQARLDAFLEVYAAANQGTASVSNQGQAMDGFSELANYRAAAKAALGDQE